MSTSDLKHLFDFSDKFNPMLVKELRQGLRGPGFVALFISFQAILAFILLFTAALASHENAGHLISRTIFFLFSCAVLIVQPLRGITSLSSEIKSDTIDLLCLTRLSSWRITFGKWVSLVSQSALILTAITPYFVFRYFFGSMQIFSEIMLLLSIFVTSATLVACAIGLSGTKSLIIKLLLPLVSSIFILSLIFNVFVRSPFAYQSMLQIFDFSSGDNFFILSALFIMCIYVAWMSLDFGCSQIAPIAENRATQKRLISFAMITISLIAMGISDLDSEVAITLGVFLCIPIIITSLTESPQLVPSITVPFTKKGLLGKIAGRLLYPGWATGLLFVLLLFILMQIAHFIVSPKTWHYHDDLQLITLVIFSALLLPVAFTRIFAKKSENRFGLFMLFMASQILIVCFCFAIEEMSSGPEVFPYFCWIPLTLPILDSGYGFPPQTITVIAWINILAYFFIALATSRPAWEEIRITENRVQNLTQS